MRVRGEHVLAVGNALRGTEHPRACPVRRGGQRLRVGQALRADDLPDVLVLREQEGQIRLRGGKRQLDRVRAGGLGRREGGQVAGLRAIGRLEVLKRVHHAGGGQQGPVAEVDVVTQGEVEHLVLAVRGVPPAGGQVADVLAVAELVDQGVIVERAEHHVGLRGALKRGIGADRLVELHGQGVADGPGGCGTGLARRTGRGTGRGRGPAGGSASVGHTAAGGECPGGECRDGQQRGSPAEASRAGRQGRTDSDLASRSPSSSLNWGCFRRS